MRCGTDMADRSGIGKPGRAAFTLIEMLMVLAIIGIIVAIALPGFKGLTRSNVLSNANRQILDDLALARQRAMVWRTTVHVVFVPPQILVKNFNTADQLQGARLRNGVFSSYAMFAERSVGDQPGQPNFRYITQWKSLPEGVFVRTNEFNMMLPDDWRSIQDGTTRPFLFMPLPFPNATGETNDLPQVAFGPHGGLVDDQGTRVFGDEVIELTRGSLLFQRDSNGVIVDVDPREVPPIRPTYDSDKNWIRIDGLTGRAKLEKPEIQ